MSTVNAKMKGPSRRKGGSLGDGKYVLVPDLVTSMNRSWKDILVFNEANSLIT